MTAPKPTLTEQAGDLQAQILALKTRLRLMARGYLVLSLVTAAAIWMSFNAGTSASRAIKTVATSNHQGAVQRVTTISQRCDLTAKIADVLGKDDPQRLSAFQVSYEQCLVGLRKAEELAAGEKPAHAKH